MKKHPLFALLPVALLGLTGLAGCGEQAPTVSLTDNSTELVASWAEGEHFSLPTYGVSNKQGLPYSKVSDFNAAIAGINKANLNVTRGEDGIYTVGVKDNAQAFVLKADPAKDILTVGTPAYGMGSNALSNNGILPDFGNPFDTVQSLVHTSEKTQWIGTPAAEVYDMGKYGIDIVEKDQELYMPTQLLSNIYMRGNGIDLMHNGRDLYVSAAVSNIVGVSAGFYSANGTFVLPDGKNSAPTIFSKAKIRENRPDGKKEAYRFSAAGESLNPDPASRMEGTVNLVLFTDGTGMRTFYSGDAIETEFEDRYLGMGGYRFVYSWKASGSAIDVNRFIIREAEEGGDQKVPDADWRINMGAGWFNAKTRPQSVIDFTYGLLRFQLDTEYGLRQIKGYADAEKLFESVGVKEGLKSANSADYDQALGKLLVSGPGLDDGHTGYVLASVFSGLAALDARSIAIPNLGPRYQGIMAAMKTYGGYRDAYFKSLGTEEETMRYFDMDRTLQKGLFVHDSTAIIRFDSFISNSKEPFIARNIDPGIPLSTEPQPYSYMNSDVPYGFALAFRKIAENPAVKDVVIDLSNNTGGMILCMPFLMACLTDDPIFAVTDACKGATMEFHYKVDIDNDGQYGTAKDTYKGKYNFYFLTSPVSFSCGNALPGLGKNAGAKIIGQKSGGGGCSVAGYSDGSGSYYQLSSNFQMSYKADGKYINNDAGIPLDKEWTASADWYDPAKVHAFIQGMK